MDAHPLADLAICVGAGWVAGFTAHRLRQPIILGYLVAGYLVGPQGFGLVGDPQGITGVAEIGLALLLFLVGLEMDLKRLMGMGRTVLYTAPIQVVGCTALAWLAFHFAGVGQGAAAGKLDAFYLAFAAALSSTVIGVKLLQDKLELGTLAGRITVGVLVFQDIAAIVFVGLQPTLLSPQLPAIALTLTKIVALIALALLASRYVLPVLFRAVAMRPELVVLGALAWCFALAGVASGLGLSKELGALSAGMAISTFPYALDVEAKVASLRDFFVTLFFVTLGIAMPQPEAGLLSAALLIVLVVLASRALTVFVPVYLTGCGSRAGVVASLNLAQISELSIVLVALGQPLGHVGSAVGGPLLYAFIVLAILSSYGINGSDAIYRWFAPLLRRLRLREGPRQEAEPEHAARGDIFVLGFYRLASSLLEEIVRTEPDWLARLTIVDFNPNAYSALRERGVRVLYGDISQRDTLERVGVQHARLVLCTVSDLFLKGINQERLIRNVRALNPDVRIVSIAETIEQQQLLRDAGADYVIVPRLLAAADCFAAIRAFDGNLLPQKANEVTAQLKDRREILP
jgi:Kef-type K+ transport system membrane component KefB